MDPFEFPDWITRYTVEHTSEVDPVLNELYRTTYLKTVHPQMISGKVQGQLLTFISQMIQPERILEIGTFTGYSAYCLTRGLKPGGKLITIEINEELKDLITDFFETAGIKDKTELIIGDAMEVVPRIQQEFDLVFIDANKELYPAYYEACMEVLRPGGVIIADNVLWGGKVAASADKDTSTKILDEFNKMVQEDPRVENVFLTVRDGLMLIRKK